MSDISRVLCAIELTEPSRRALDCALWWARRHGADVSVLHVHRLAVTTPDTGSLHGDASAGAPAEAQGTLDPDERGARQLEVERFVEQARTDGVQIEVLLDEDASVADAIVARADALAADLVVVGAGADPSSEHPMLGHTTAALLRAAPCSVLVVPAPAADVANPCVSGLHQVMCAVSLAEQSDQVLEYAAGLATESTAHLAVVHVVELVSEVAALAYDFDEHREVRVQPACEELVALVARVIGHENPVEEIVAHGTACDEILKLAAEESTDLIVVGHGSGRRARGVGRPTGQAIAREARCPVLFVYPIGFDASRPFADSHGYRDVSRPA
ncbi:MAG TPA: universal stress protein [Vicinamibacterales bacterium]|nr:universal stress protein [Vicinamibacterales bacterium]